MPHGDCHDLWFDPQNPRRMIHGNDGGACVSFNGGVSWSTLDNQPTAQFYHVTTDTRHPYRVYGSQQDNTSITVPSRTATGSISIADWFSVGGGECGYIAIRPDDPDIIFAGNHSNGYVSRYNHRTGQVRNIMVWPEPIAGWGAKDMRYRFQWTFPILLSPHDPNVLYVTGNIAFRSTDEGTSWEAISPDLTRNDVTQDGAVRRAGLEGRDERGILRHHLRLRGVAGAAGAAVGGVRRRAGARVAGQRRGRGRT